MTPEQFAAILLGIAAVLGAVARCIAEVRTLHRTVDGKMEQLLTLTASASHAEGVIEGEGRGVLPTPPKDGPKDPPSATWRRGHN